MISWNGIVKNLLESGLIYVRRWPKWSL